MECSLGILSNHGLESYLVSTLHLLLDLAANKSDEGGHAVDTELLCEISAFVNIDLDEYGLALILLCELLVDGLNHLAGRAP